MMRQMVKWLASVAVLTQLLTSQAFAQAAGDEKMLGIEIGSKAIKPVIGTYSAATKTVAQDRKPQRQSGLLVGLKDGKLSPASITATVQGVKATYDDLNAGIKPSKISVVISSGIVIQSEPESIDELVKQLQAALPPETKIDTIRYEDEVRYTLLSIVRRKEALGVPDAFSDALVFDIGSGNTKFGYLVKGDGKWACEPKTNCAEVKVGTTALEKQVKPDGTPEDTFAGLLTDTQTQLETLLAEIKFSGKKIYVTGGASFVVAGNAKPDEVLGKPAKPVVPITAADVTKLLDNPKVVPADIGKIFNERQRIVAGNLMKVSLAALTKTFGTAEFSFVSGADTFWIEEYVREKLGDVLSPNAAAPVAAPAPATAPVASAADPKNEDLLRRIQELETRVRMLEDRSKKSEGDPMSQMRKTLDQVAENTKSTTDEVRELKNVIKRLSEAQGVMQPVDQPKRIVFNGNAAMENFRRGMALLEAQDPLTARGHFQQAVGSDDGEPKYWYALALTQLASGERDAAAASVEAYWNLFDRGVSTAFGETFIKVQGPGRTAVEDLVNQVRDSRLRTSVPTRTK